MISRRALTKEQEEKEAEVNRQFEQLLQDKFGDSGGLTVMDLEEDSE